MNEQESNIEEWRSKAEKWDTLCELISKHYDTPDPNSTRESDLIAIGEIASAAFGWMHLYKTETTQNGNKLQ